MAPVAERAGYTPTQLWPTADSWQSEIRIFNRCFSSTGGRSRHGGLSRARHHVLRLLSTGTRGGGSIDPVTLSTWLPTGRLIPETANAEPTTRITGGDEALVSSFYHFHPPRITERLIRC